jgi:hypothetical protein
MHYIQKNVRKESKIGLRHETQDIRTETLAQPLATTLCHLLLPKAGKQAGQKVAQYASRYRLAFTLLNEDISTGAAPRGWEVEGSVESAYGPA